MSTVTTSPLAACCATNVPRDVRPAGASTVGGASAKGDHGSVDLIRGLPRQILDLPRRGTS